MKSPVMSNSVACPSPTMRGSSQAAPMSAPDRPTFVNRNAIFADSAAMHVARRGDDGARSRDSAIQRADDRAPALSQREDEVAREAGELEQPGSVAREQRPDDVLHVAARAERPPGPGDDHGPDPRLAVERAEGVPQLAVDGERQGVESIRPIERGRGEAL